MRLIAGGTRKNKLREPDEQLVLNNSIVLIHVILKNQLGNYLYILHYI